MPLNASPEFLKAMEKYSSARTTSEKIRALEEALRYAPRHKGAEKTRALLMRRLAELKRESRSKKQGVGKTEGIQKEGYLITLFGYGNSGKSSILRELTDANVAVTEYPFSTVKPVSGMLKHIRGKIQLVEVPSYFDGYADSKLGRVGLSVLRISDAVALVVDLSLDPISQVETLLNFLESESIFPGKSPPLVKVERRHSGGISFQGTNFMDGKKEEYIKILHNNGIYNAVVVFLERTTPMDFEIALNPSSSFPDLILVGTKKGFEDRFIKLRYKKVLFGGNPREVSEELVKELGLIRIYTKPPRGTPAEEPLIMKSGARVTDVARRILKGKKMKYARVWGSTKFPGQKVGGDYFLSDGDIVEIH